MPTDQKVTYLLGAGASYNALPLAREIHPHIVNMMHYIDSFEKYIGGGTKLTKTWEIVNIIKEHYSIDTLARKYKLKDDTEKYKRVKNIIACLIIFLQTETQSTSSIPVAVNLSTHQPVRTLTKQNNRYDAFLAALLDDEFYLPKNINIISWNYDFQFEQALSFYSGNNLFATAHDYNIHSNVYTADLISDVGAIIKINGTGLLQNEEKLNFEYNTYDKHLHSLFIGALKDEISPQIKNNISFSWEKSPNGSKSRNLAMTIMKNTDILVVIGYSFPTFNRPIDIDLFSNFRRKVYIQDVPERVTQIRNQLDAIRPGLSELCQTQTDCDQFLIPNEYWSIKDLDKF